MARTKGAKDKRPRAAKRDAATANDGTERGRGLDLDMPLILTGQRIDDHTHELVEADGTRKPVPIGFALTRYFGSKESDGTLPVYRAAPFYKVKS